MWKYADFYVLLQSKSDYDINRLGMGRLMAIDYGRKRCGVAVTDTLRIVATALATVPSGELIKFVKEYMGREQVDEIIVGLPKTLSGEASESMRYITPARTG